MSRQPRAKQSTVRLQHINRDNVFDALELQLTDADRQFVSDSNPPAAIPLVRLFLHEDHHEVWSYGIYARNRMVGFFNLVRFAEQPDELWIFHFFIDDRHQSSGYGTSALEQVIELIRRDHIMSSILKLTVHPENQRAAAFYRRFGFIHTSEIAFDEPVYRYSIIDHS